MVVLQVSPGCCTYTALVPSCGPYSRDAVEHKQHRPQPLPCVTISWQCANLCKAGRPKWSQLRRFVWSEGPVLAGEALQSESNCNFHKGENPHAPCKSYMSHANVSCGPIGCSCVAPRVAPTHSGDQRVSGQYPSADTGIANAFWFVTCLILNSNNPKCSEVVHTDMAEPCSCHAKVL